MSFATKARGPMMFAAAATLAVGITACGSSSKKSSASGAVPPCNGSSQPTPNNGGYPTTASTQPVVSSFPSGKPGAGKPTIVLGDKNFSEEFLIGDLYEQALQSAGYTVDLKPNLGSSEIVETALKSGQIEMYPEYTGVIYTELADIGQTATSAEATYAASKAWEAKEGFTVLNPTPFQDADGVAVEHTYGQKYGLKTIGDLAKVGPFSYAGPPENANRFQGVVGLKQAYCLNKLSFVPLTTGTQYTALDSGKVNSIAIFTTDGQLASGKYDVLTDTKGIFGYQQVVPVIKNSLVSEEGPAFSQILNLVDSKLTFPAIRSMNEAVQIDQKDPATVAHQFLAANKLLGS